MTTPYDNLTDEQKAAVDSGTHVIDPVHGFVPALPTTEPTADGSSLVQDPPGAATADGLSEGEVIQAQAQAVQEGSQQVAQLDDTQQ